MMTMNHRILIFIGIILSVALYTTGAATIRKQKETKTKWELIEALQISSQIRGFNGTWITGDEFYYTASDRSIRKFNARNNTDSDFLSDEFLELYSGGTFTLSPDNTKILVRFNRTELFRHSFIANYDVFDIETRTSKHIHNGVKLQYCGWSPVKDRLSYVYENNVYIHFEAGLELAITDSGVDGIVYNGVPDWVYEEEVLSSGSAIWWSPDGTRLAVGFFNDTEVRTFKYTLYGEAQDPAYQYPKEVELKYPKSGTPNPIVAVRIFDLGKVEPSSVLVKAPVAIVTTDHILQNVAWANDTELLITWLNRRQNVSTIQSCTVTGDCHEVIRITEPDGWVDIGIPKCLANGMECFFTNWIDDWYQVWKLNLKTGENAWKSRGNFTVLRVYGYDEVNDTLYYQATLPHDPSVYQVFRNDDCLTCNLRDVDGDLCLTASASFSKDYSYYAVICSGPNPRYTKIFNTQNNTEVTTWESNSAFRAKLATKLRPTIKFLNVTLADGTVGYAKLQLPPGLDELDVNKTYPMIVYVYGGPNSVRVLNDFQGGFDIFMTTNREVIYASIDGRGTGNKGKKTLFSVNNQLGVFEVEDQIYVTKQLQEMFPYIDRERTGIWGWSYGGYMTARTLAADDDRVFQCGVSVAPVTSWLYYDTIYTERYMGLPTANDNLKNYVHSAAFSNLKNFRTHDFLLMHGAGDDNVHYQQSLLLSKMLQHNDILFEEMIYPDENHGIGNYLSHLYKTQDRFWVNCLNIDVSDEFEF